MEGQCAPIRVNPQNDSQIFFSVHMLSLKFCFKQDFVIPKEETFDDSGELFYTIVVTFHKWQRKNVDVTSFQILCTGSLSPPPNFTSVVNSKFSLVVCIVHNVQVPNLYLFIWMPQR